MGGYLDERKIVGDALATWTACPIFWPDSEFEAPQPTASPETPVSYIAAEIEYIGSALLTMAGGQQVNGEVTLDVIVEMRSGDDQVRDHFEALQTLFESAEAAAEAVGMYFLAPRPGPPVVIGQDWYGRRLSIPFVRFRPA